MTQQNNEVQAALEWYEKYFSQVYGGYIPDLPHHKTIRAALSQDVNEELLEALKMAESFIRKMSGGGETDFRKKLNKAIARAEAQKVGE